MKSNEGHWLLEAAPQGQGQDQATALQQRLRKIELTVAGDNI